jgi:hypothetical protein
VDINGNTVITEPGQPPASDVGGLLALSSNIGRFTRQQATAIPEMALDLGYQFGCHVRVHGGYSLLYWTGVFRPGDQINLNVNPVLIPPAGSGGANQPQPRMKQSDLFVHGFNLGVEVRY